ncbi:C40 family peptidase [Streptomyces inusitatus]|uniref:C40 family peptidase n=1 Tax=Streptomyces inusitatus TaxID=68221 RepID=UPI00167F09E1|nr:C40 family peptidase [Streptomyces inusitatus]
MSGGLLRTVCTAALVTAVAVTAAPAPPWAAAAERRPGDAAVPVPGEQGAAGPGAEAVPEALTRLQTLYRDAEEAGASHSAAERRLKAQRARTARLGRELTRAREELGRSRVAAGRLAREQYQGHSELSSLLRALLARHPDQAFAQAHLLERAAAHRLTTTARLEKGAERAAALEREARAALARERELASARKRARDTATRRLRAVEESLASLTAAQIARLTSPGVRDQVMAAGGPSTFGRRPTERGAKAVRYAVEQIGKPYVWGAEGPWSYDCSGLTSQAWAAAGLRIPRTSQEQWARLTRVPLSELRPGDLVVYFPGATHVAIYLGDGTVVQAPRPGAVVKVSPVAANPVLGAVRPDPDGAVLGEGAYVPPPLPEGAAAGDDTGYSAAEAPAEAVTSARYSPASAGS